MRVRGSGGGRDACAASGDSDKGALAACCGAPRAGATCRVTGLVGTDGGAAVAVGAAAAVTGAAAASGWSPWIEKVLILRGSLLGMTPFEAAAPDAAPGGPGIVLGDTLAAVGGFAF